jgi:DNA-binding LacI/PurR family transcriptional regulator
MAVDRVTIPQLARELGVSVGTVSSALNGTGRVAPATRQLVLDHAAARGYRKNSAARSLKLGATQAIELHLPRNARHLSFYVDFAFGVVDAADAAGLDVLLTTADRPRSGGVLTADGAVFIDCEEHSERLRELVAAGVPVVAADGAPVPGPKPNLSIEIDYDDVMGQLLRSAVSSGARRPMLVAPDLSLASSWRDRITAAFTRWCDTLGVPAHVRRFPVNGPDTDIVALARTELERPDAPDAMIFAGQRLAAVCSSALQLGFSDSAVPWIASCAGDPLSEVAAPQISALDTQPHEFGRRSGAALATRIVWAEHWALGD